MNRAAKLAVHTAAIGAICMGARATVLAAKDMLAKAMREGLVSGEPSEHVLQELDYVCKSLDTIGSGLLTSSGNAARIIDNEVR